MGSAVCGLSQAPFAPSIPVPPSAIFRHNSTYIMLQALSPHACALLRHRRAHSERPSCDAQAPEDCCCGAKARGERGARRRHGGGAGNCQPGGAKGQCRNDDSCSEVANAPQGGVLSCCCCRCCAMPRSWRLLITAPYIDQMVACIMQALRLCRFVCQQCSHPLSVLCCRCRSSATGREHSPATRRSLSGQRCPTPSTPRAARWSLAGASPSTCSRASPARA